MNVSRNLPISSRLSNLLAWYGWMVSPTQWTWVWVNSGSWWWTGRPGVLRFMGSQRVGHDWVTELNWTDRDIWLGNKSVAKRKEEITVLPTENQMVPTIEPDSTTTFQPHGPLEQLCSCQSANDHSMVPEIARPGSHSTHVGLDIYCCSLISVWIWNNTLFFLYVKYCSFMHLFQVCDFI